MPPRPGLLLLASAAGFAGVSGLALAWFLRRRRRSLAPDAIPASDRALVPRGPLVKGRRFKLGRNERQYVRMALDHANAVKIFYCCRFKGSPPEIESIRRACRALQTVHPILRCVLVRSQGEEYEFVETDVEIPILVRRNTTSRAVFETEAEFAPLELERDPMVKVWLIVNEFQGEFELAVDAQHVTMDGSSLVIIMHQLLDFTLSGPEAALRAEHGAWPEPQCAALDRTIQHWPWWRRAEAFLYGVSAMLGPLMRSVAPVPTNGCTETHKNRSFTVHCELTLDETQRCLKSIKSNGATVTTAVTACYAAALAEALGDSRPILSLCIVADTRSMTSPPVNPADLSIHVVSAPLYVDSPADHSSLWSLATRLKAHLQSSMDRLVDFAVVWSDLAASMQPAHSGLLVKVPSLVVSSWSARPPVKASYGGIPVLGGLLFQNVAHAGWLALSIYSPVQGGPLVVTLLAPTPRFDPKFISRVAEGGAKRLRELALEAQ